MAFPRLSAWSLSCFGSGAVREGRVAIVKGDSDTNFGDLMTKHLAEDKMLALLENAGFEFRDGRAPGALELTPGAVKQRVAAVLLGMGS